MAGRIVKLDWITRDMLRAEPEARFVFGDNSLRKGLGGQAKAMRGEPNAIGVPTKRRPDNRPGAFFDDASTDDERALMQGLNEIKRALKENRTVYVPADGIGTGLARLPEVAPRLYAEIVSFLEQHTEDR